METGDKSLQTFATVSLKGNFLNISDFHSHDIHIFKRQWGEWGKIKNINNAPILYPEKTNFAVALSSHLWGVIKNKYGECLS